MFQKPKEKENKILKYRTKPKERIKKNNKNREKKNKIKYYKKQNKKKNYLYSVQLHFTAKGMNSY